jgi:2-polyprenyl-3-methyl-5-hydroxy-6-metoxy-1,4-benzoquinol methylase
MRQQFFETPVEAVQEYWDARPCNVRHSTAELGSRQYFDEVEQRKYFVEPHIPRFAEFERWAGRRVLEVGCGIGTDTMNFARHGAEVTAVDLSERSLELARKRAAVYGFEDRITFQQADCERLDEFVPVEPYDLVYSFGVIHHTPDPERALEQIRRYVRPGGTFKLMVYNRRSWKVLWILLVYGKGRFWRLSELVARHSEAQTGCPVTYAYSRRELRRLLERFGFQVEELFAEHIFPYRIRDYLQYSYRRVWYFRALPRPVFRWLERRLGWPLCVTATVSERTE